jgi:hypothetical protein
MTQELWCVLPSVIATVNVRDGNPGQLVVRDVFEAPYVDPVHLANRSFVSDAKGTNTAALAEVVVILLGIEQILSKVRSSRQETEAIGLCHSWPETRSPAD